MEREYIYFHTGEGFAVLVIGVFFIIIVALGLLSITQSKWIYILVTLLSSIVVVWAAFRLDERSLKQRKRNLNCGKDRFPRNGK
ncbi:MAG: hypothetical protein GTN76_10050 [Candidatus Aenigmarchaeota archaeon]|nr:hypothetical protein [Candidatus Aenigmarchaeota archaeon]